MNRDATLDYLRGFAIVAIVIGHLYYYSNRAEGSIVWSLCNSIQIPIFIYVSGLLTNKSILKYGFFEFLKKRVIRLIIPFFSIFIIWLLIHGICIDNIIIFYTDEFKQGFWFLFVLFELMLILSINQFVSKQCGINRILLDCGTLIIINAYHFFAKDFDLINQALCFNLLWHYYPVFMIGVYSNNIIIIYKLKLSAIYLSIFCIAFYLMFFKNIHTMLAICNITSLFFFITLIKNGNKIEESTFVRIGQYSLEIYLLHIIAFDLLQYYIPIIKNRWLEVVSYFFLAFIICILLIHISSILKKNKILNRLLFGE